MCCVINYFPWLSHYLIWRTTAHSFPAFGYIRKPILLYKHNSSCSLKLLFPDWEKQSSNVLECHTTVRQTDSVRPAGSIVIPAEQIRLNCGKEIVKVINFFWHIKVVQIFVFMLLSFSFFLSQGSKCQE